MTKPDNPCMPYLADQLAWFRVSMGRHMYQTGSGWNIMIVLGGCSEGNQGGKGIILNKKLGTREFARSSEPLASMYTVNTRTSQKTTNIIYIYIKTYL